jgi:hypothetical protein
VDVRAVDEKCMKEAARESAGIVPALDGVPTDRSQRRDAFTRNSSITLST